MHSCGVKKSPINEAIRPSHSIENLFKKLDTDKSEEVSPNRRMATKQN